MSAVKALTPRDLRAETWWFVARGNKMMGPYTSDQLKSALASHNLEAGDYGWRQGFREWRPLCTVEELELTPGPCLLSAYPTIDLPMVPSAKTQVRRVGGNVVQDTPEPAKVVRLRRGNHFRMGLVERAGMLMFALGLAYIAVSVALSEVETRISRGLELMALGHGEILGETPEQALPMEMWAPLLSAPGLLEDPAFSLPVSLEGRPVPQSPAEWSVGEWKVHSQHPWTPWQAQDRDFDPVYIQPVSIHGRWKPTQPGSVELRVPGYPSL